MSTARSTQEPAKRYFLLLANDSQIDRHSIQAVFDVLPKPCEAVAVFVRGPLPLGDALRVIDISNLPQPAPIEIEAITEILRRNEGAEIAVKGLR